MIWFLRQYLCSAHMLAFVLYNNNTSNNNNNKCRFFCDPGCYNLIQFLMLSNHKVRDLKGSWKLNISNNQIKTMPWRWFKFFWQQEQCQNCWSILPSLMSLRITSQQAILKFHSINFMDASSHLRFSMSQSKI